MARIRTIKPEFPQSESMGRVSREARLCFIMLWTIADDAGRLRGNSRMLASLLFPYDGDAGERIEGWLDELAHETCIDRYTVNGDRYIEIVAFGTHQKIDKPSASKLPAKPDNSESPREDSANLRESSFTPAEKMPRKGMEGNGGEGNGTLANRRELAEPTVDHRELAKKLGVKCDYEWEKFADHEWKGRVPRDRDRAFRNWLRKAAEFALRDGKIQAPDKPLDRGQVV